MYDDVYIYIYTHEFESHMFFEEAASRGGRRKEGKEGGKNTK